MILITKETIEACPTRVALDRLVGPLRPDDCDPELRLAIATRYFEFAERRHEHADTVLAKAHEWLGDQPFPYVELDLSQAYCGEVTRKLVEARTDITCLRLPYGAQLADWMPAILNNRSLEVLDASYLEVDDMDMEALARMSSLEGLDISNIEVTGTGFQFILTYPSLKSLDLKNTSVTSEGLEPWLPSGLESITRSNIRLDAESGAHLATCKGLRSLRLNEAGVLQEGLRELKSLRTLTQLWLDKCHLRDEHLALIADIASLEDLSIEDNSFTDLGLAELARLPNLKKLSLGGAELSSIGLNALKENKQIEYLSLGGPGSFENLDPPAWIASLKNLYISCCSVDQHFWEMFPEKNSLEFLSIDVSGTQADDVLRLIQRSPLKELTVIVNKGAKPLTWFPAIHATLEEVWIHQDQISRSAVDSLLSAPNLKQVDLANCAIEPGTPLDFRQCTQLEQLLIGSSGITDADLAGLRNHPALVSIFMAGNHITNEGIRALGRIGTLEALHVERTLVTGEGLDWEAQFPNLQRLSLEGAPIDDETFKAIASLPNLESLWLENRLISPEGYSALAGNESIKELHGVIIPTDPLTHPIVETLASMTALGYLTLDIPIPVTEELTTRVRDRLHELGSRCVEVHLTQTESAEN